MVARRLGVAVVGRGVVGVGAGPPVAAARLRVEGGRVVVVVVVVGVRVRVEVRGVVVLLPGPHWWVRDVELRLVRVERDGRWVEVEVGIEAGVVVRVVQRVELLVAGVEELAGGGLVALAALVAVKVRVVVVVVFFVVRHSS